MSWWGFFSNLFSFQPGLLIETTDGEEEGQEEHPEHEVGGRPEVLVDLEAEVEEEEGGDSDDESVGAHDHHGVVFVVKSLLGLLQCRHRPVLLSKDC